MSRDGKTAAIHLRAAFEILFLSSAFASPFAITPEVFKNSRLDGDKELRRVENFSAPI